MTIVRIRLTPKASRNAISGWMKAEDGHDILKVSVTAVPEKGKANQALIALLAQEWHLPKSAFTLLKGDTDRNKILNVDGDIPIPLSGELPL